MNRKLFDSLNEKQQRLYLGELAAEYGKGGITNVPRTAGRCRAATDGENATLPTITARILSRNNRKKTLEIRRRVWYNG